MSEASTYVYVTYIRAPQQKVWDMLTQPAFIEEYWFGMKVESDFRSGSPWKLRYQDGAVADAGEILEADAPRRLVIRWRNEAKPELTAEGFSRCVMELEETNGAVRLTITHALEQPRPHSKFIESVSGGWPKVLSNLKSLAESGAVALAKAY